jgi:hypothetical protein
MRDPGRIDEILEAIRRVWKENPDLRLGQLLIDAVIPRIPAPDIFSIEDSRILVQLNELEERLAMSDWSIYRQEDDGKEYLVDSGLTKCIADAKVLELESQGHKQFYWAMQVPRQDV